MQKNSVKWRIFRSNAIALLSSLLLLVFVNLGMLHWYGESIEREWKQTMAQIATPAMVENLIADWTIRRNSFLALFLADGLICMAILIIVGLLFTRNLARHICRPLHALEDGVRRMQENDLKTPIDYHGDLEFETVCHAFNEMQLHLSEEQEKNKKYERARIDMIAGISHDLKTPLTAIRGSIKAILDGIAAAPDMQKTFLSTAYRRTGDMELLLNQLFYLSRLETGNLPIHSVSLELSSWLSDYVVQKRDFLTPGSESLYFSSVPDCSTKIPTVPASADSGSNLFSSVSTGSEASSDISASADSEPISPVPIFADPEQLKRILDNLLVNSRKYANVQPLKMQISLKTEAGSAIICFSDNGNGVSPDVLPHLFEEFYRGDASRSKPDGHGLGLYIVKYLTEAMAGTVRAESQNGFSVILTFPILKRSTL